MPMWLIRDEVARTLEGGHRAGFVASAAQYEQFAAAMAQITVAAVPGKTAALSAPRNMRIAGDVAEIRVEGILTPKPDFMAWLLGGGNTTYEQIQQALALAESDPNIKRVVMFYDSPGGTTQGFFDTFAALQSMTKKVSARVAYACSAAFGLACGSGPIEATNAAVELGSVGVCRKYMTDDDVIDIANTDSPAKRPDPKTDEGKAMIRKELDEVFGMFVETIAAGRGTTVKDVTENYGQGAIVLAGDAKKRGMIDKISKPTLRAVTVDQQHATAAQGGAKQRRETMTEAELKAQHPELHAAVLAQGNEAGKLSERKRVNSHLKMAKSFGAMDVAIKAISDGTSVTDEEVHADYMTAGKNKSDAAVRQAESDPVAAATAAAAAPPAVARDLGDMAADAMFGSAPTAA